LRNSNIFREGSIGKRLILRWLLAAFAIVCLVNTANALDPNRSISKYIHDRWGAEQGFPGGAVYAVTQTTDGYLWIGAEKGLVRFDGLSFRLYNHANTADFPASPILGLIADAARGLWIRSQNEGLLRYRGGTFQVVLPNLVGAEINAMFQAKNGELLVSRASRPLRYSAGKFVELSPNANPLVISMAETGDGKVWIGTRDAGLFYLSGGRVSSVSVGLPDRKINSLVPLGDRELWVGTDNGMVRWNGSELTRAGLPHSLDHVQILGMARDHDSNIWVASPHGLSRINARNTSLTEDHGSLTEDYGLPAGETVTALFEDREGSLWVGNSSGIERFRDTLFLTYAPPGISQSENYGPLYADAQGRTWFAPSEGGLFWLKGNITERILDAGLGKDVIYSISGGADELWIGRQRGGLTHLRYRTATVGEPVQTETYTTRDGLAQNSVYVVHENRDGTVWAGTLSGGVSRFQNGRFTTYNSANGLASNTVSAIEESSNGTMWFATSNGLSALSNNRWRVYTGQDGLPPGGVNSLLEDRNGALWIGTADGLAFLTSGRIQIPRDVPDSLRQPVFGVAEDKNGWLWIATSTHVLRVNREKLLHGALDDADVREYGIDDGLRGSGVKRGRSVVADPLGRVWLSLNSGIFVVDPARLTENLAPTPILLQGISADENILDLNKPARIPSARRRITFSYMGLNLSTPDRIRYRYMLDNFDHGWSEPVAAREAVYTNLNPGSYRFRVIARNPEGVWNKAAAAITFEIEPAFWQTWWFRLSCLGTSAALALLLYRYRLSQLSRQLNVRFEERLAERTRIAQELHDTLLQGFLSASMQLNVTVDGLPEDSPVKPRLSRTLQLMEKVIEEGRNVVRGLRPPKSGPLDLEQAFCRVHRELAVQEDVEFRVIVEGHRRALVPAVRDEAYRIGREALVNAFCHSQARNIEAELEYGTAELRILVRDNGRGLDPQVLRSGREGHWGLPGMRERAESIGARLSLWSSPTAGTEVELAIPGHVAFPNSPVGRPLRWFRRWYPRRAETGNLDAGSPEI
jgi:signal transduction histidine kinase/ligand-binding sensor domain-containing protein